jgi:hypothetical protein
VADDLVDHLVVEHGRDLVNGVGVETFDDGFRHHVAEQRDLAPLLDRNRAVGAAQQDVRLDADLAEFLDRMLGRLGLQLAGGRDVRQQCQMHVTDVVAALLDTHLADGFQEGQRLDVADGAAHLDDRHVGPFGAGLDLALDLVGDVRNDLDRLAEILAPALLSDDRIVDLARREVVAPAHPGAGEALVVTQIEVGLGAVLGDENLAVLEWTHRPRVDVDVGIELEVGDPDTAGFENGPQRRGGDALAQRGHDTACNEYEFGHGKTGCGKAES